MTWHGHPLLVMLRPCADLLGSKLQRVGRETDCGPLGAGVSPDYDPSLPFHPSECWHRKAMLGPSGSFWLTTGTRLKVGLG